MRLRASVDVRELVRDLEAFGDELDEPIRDVLEHGASSIADAARPLMRFRAEGAWPTSSGAKYGHIRAYYEGKLTSSSTAVVFSDHPAAPVWEWGGTIHPLVGHEVRALISRPGTRQLARSALKVANQLRPPYTFEIPRLEPVQRAAAVEREHIEEELESAIQDLIDEHHLNG
jgi:hypothetical protein